MRFSHLGTPPPQASTPVDPELLCPECNSSMMIRTNRANGSKFYGCTQFPSCRGSRTEAGIASKIVNAALEQRLSRILKAAVLRSEEECLTFTEDDLRRVDDLQLSIEPVPDENAYVVTVVKP